ncbi:MAG TPA: YceI family protein [Phenylobacterium sp.]|jgi:polyisoprenoid-binding protein YceI|uniref:YceI family protein n=1 Tax=Phenylobacterium sp. TaxID=1871053 RepID=UPI002C134E7F|nr:YceI family protein [Phenylobacterium sp.]HXA38435.1 YceI family protein [Phenylobacterium sp.]
MKTLHVLAAAKAASVLLIAGPAIAATAPAAPQPPAGSYAIDKAHTSVTFRVVHLGFSHYTARFSKIDGKLRFDPAAPATMAVEATIDPTSLELNTPPAGFHDELMGKNWFNAAAFPAIAYRSTKVEVTGPNTARVTGDFTLHGVTKPVVLEVTYNGGYPPNSFDPGGARIGFSAHGVFKRSAFGMGAGVPAPGSTMGVSDEVEVAIETEFSGGKPAAKK